MTEQDENDQVPDTKDADLEPGPTEVIEENPDVEAADDQSPKPDEAAGDDQPGGRVPSGYEARHGGAD